MPKVLLRNFNNILLVLIFIYLYYNFYSISVNMSLINQLEEVEGRITIFNFLPYIILLYIIFLSLFLKKIYLNKVVKASLLFGFYVTVSNILAFQSGSFTASKIIVNSVHILLPSYLLFYLHNAIRNNIINIQKYKSITLLAFALFVGTYFYFVFVNFGNALLNEFAAFNSAYYLILFLPIILYLSNSKKNNNIAIIIVFLAVLLSFKRGGILALVLGFLGYYYTNSLLITKVKAVAVFKMLLALVFLFIGLLFINSLVNDYIFERFSNLSEDKGSARTEIITEVLEHFSKLNVFEKLIGKGGEATMSMNVHELSAHNDFIEILVNYGYIGLFLLIVFLIQQVKFIKAEFIKKNKQIKLLVFLFLTFLVLAQVSHIVIYPLFTLYIVFLSFIISNFKHIDK